MHGFDEFFGNLYHLNAEEEPENVDYPKDPAFKAQVRPARRAEVRRAPPPRRRARIRASASGASRSCEDTGPLTIKRMETVDEEFLRRVARLHRPRATGTSKPFFVWSNSTRMHIWTHLKKESEGKTGLGVYPDGMVEHDGQVGQLLKKLDDLGIAEQHDRRSTRPTTAPRS